MFTRQQAKRRQPFGVLAERFDVFLEMGGFDESYRQPSIEDMSWAIGWKQAGYTIRLCRLCRSSI